MAESGRAAEKAVFEAGRLELARLAAGEGETKIQIWMRIARIAARVMRVNRVGYWLRMDSGQAIRCEHLYQSYPPGAVEGAVLQRRDFPGYFHALESSRVIAIEDVESDPNAAEFREAYFQPLGITAMVDSPVYRNGEIIGIVCHEQIGPPRPWTREECDFAVSVAEATGRLCAESDSSAARESLLSIQRRVENLEGMAALGRMAAGVAHDFRNVLGTAMGYLDLLQVECSGQERILARLGEIGKALEIGRTLTRDLTQFGQGEPASPRVVDLAAFLEEFRGLMGMAAGPLVRLEFSLAKGVYPVFMDRNHLERVILNLVINARDAMAGGGTLTVTLAAAGGDGPGNGIPAHASLEFRDTGTGIPPETRERIFEPFFTTKGEKGTGLGLPIVWRTVNEAGGKVEVESEPGKGSIFRLLLPGIGTAVAGPALQGTPSRTTPAFP